MNTAVQVTMYLNESDRWHHKPLHAEILQFLRKENVAGASAFHAIAVSTVAIVYTLPVS
jgi:uncharacterized protein